MRKNAHRSVVLRTRSSPPVLAEAGTGDLLERWTRDSTTRRETSSGGFGPFNRGENGVTGQTRW